MLAIAALAALAGLCGCGVNGDFGRLRPSLVRDDIHAWVGWDAAASVGAPVSRYNLTEDETMLRDLAYPLIAPPYARPRWDSALREWGRTHVFRRAWWGYDRSAYYRHLMLTYHRSTTGRYDQLIDDIRNDVVRIAPFFETARRVIDLDRRREASMTFVADLAPPERFDALARVAENTLTVAWVERALAARCAAYRYALERLVVAEPSLAAADAERALKQLQFLIAANQVVPPLPWPG